MKGACSLIAAAVAASTAALSSSSGDPAFTPNQCARGKLAPNFDGLRFIETLVTVHRSISISKKLPRHE
ncbi:hypothetical protein ACS0TY_004143 [Phlomoides rotata]